MYATAIRETVTNDELRDELKALAEKWEDEYQRYIDSELESERVMSVQQYKDTLELRRVLENYE